MKLTADRLFLRDFVLTDRDYVHEYASCFDVVRHQAWGPNNLLQTTEFVEASANEPSLEERRIFTLAAVLNDGTLIGGVLAALSNDGSEAEIGYSFNQRYWGMGYGTEAAKCLVEYLTSVHKIRRIFATCRPENAGSVNVLRKIGMRRERQLKRDVLIRGEWRDSLIFELLFPGRQA